MKRTQKQRIIGQLKEFGFIGRNACLRNYISRLSAIIQTLEEDGYEFRTEEKGGDYIYHWINRPPKIVYDYVEQPDGTRIAVERRIPYTNG